MGGWLRWSMALRGRWKLRGIMILEVWGGGGEGGWVVGRKRICMCSACDEI